MKDNVEVIDFHIKGWGVQGLVFVQITFLCSLVFNTNAFFGTSNDFYLEYETDFQKTVKYF